MRVCLAALIVLSACASSPPVRTQPRTPRRIVVALVVDQLAAWIAEERFPLLPETGGFARLRREGTYFVTAEMPHAVTDTAPGHSLLFTRVPPRLSGIFANEIVDASRERVSILRDASTRAVSAEGVTETPGSSLAALRVRTIADEVRSHDPSRTIIALSLKDRGALFAGGRAPDAALYFEPSLDMFVTSTAFAETMPEWAHAHARRDTLVALRSAPWTPLDEAWLTANAGPDDAPGEGDLGGLGRTFPHRIAGARNEAKAMRASPHGDRALLALAQSAIRSTRGPLFLAISFSSNDYVGHVFGPESREAWDELLRLDAVLAELFTALDAAAGAEGYAVVLSADHGVTPMPESQRADARWCGNEDPYERPCAPGARIDPDALTAALDSAADRALGAGDYVLGVADPYVVLTDAAKSLDDARARMLREALADALAETPGVAAAIPSETSPCPLSGEHAVSLCDAIVPGIGVFYVVPARGAFFDSTYVTGEGTSHGTPYPHDRRVPLLVRAPGLIPGGRVVRDVVPATTYGDALCTLLGLPDAGACLGARASPPGI